MVIFNILDIVSLIDLLLLYYCCYVDVKTNL